jgi:hypothetical protein
MAIDGGMITGFVLEGAIALIEYLVTLPEKDRQKIYEQMRAQKASNALDAEKLDETVRRAIEARDNNRAALSIIPDVIIPDPPAEIAPAPIVDLDGVRDILSTWTPEMKAALKAELK